MRALFYYLFGIITALFGFVITFKLCYKEVVDDYYIQLLHQQYMDEYLAISAGITSIFLVCTWVFIYNLGKGTNNDKREPLFKKEDEEITPYL